TEEPHEDQLALTLPRKGHGDLEEGFRLTLVPNHGDDRPGRPVRGSLVRRRQLRVVAEHRPLELLERGARLDPELLDEVSAGIAVRLERLRLPPGAVERAHQQGARALTQRMLANKRFDLADDVGMPPARQIGLE